MKAQGEPCPWGWLEGNQPILQLEIQPCPVRQSQIYCPELPKERKLVSFSVVVIRKCLVSYYASFL